MKNKIISELKSPEFPDLTFLYSQEALGYAPEILVELLDQEKKDFDTLLNTSDESITFDIFWEFSYLDYYFGLLYHYKSVCSGEKIRKIIEEFEPLYDDFCNEVAYSKRYYDMYCICLQKWWLTQEQYRSVTTTIQKFEQRGIALNTASQSRLKDLNKELSELSMRFSNNELDSENSLEYFLQDDTSLGEMPNRDKEVAQKRAKEKSKSGYLFDASMWAYLSFMKYCNNSEQRKTYHDMQMSIASFGEYDNTDVVLQTIALRQEKAQILWYKSYAEMSLVFKMAENAEQVENLVKQVSDKSFQKAQQEVDELKKYFGLVEMAPWDTPYYSRIYKKEKYDFDENILKPYFEFENVLQGLFSICYDLFGVEIRESKKWETYAKYHPDVIIREIYKDGKFLSYFVWDYFYRTGKDSWAWNNNLRDKHDDISTLMVNVASFEKSIDGPTLLYLRDVETIFHEFGHALHHILSQDKYPDLGRWVEWDFVELPSQLMENWCRKPEVLDRFALHYERREKIPQNIIESLELLRKYGTGLQYTGYHYLELFDFWVHWENTPKTRLELQEGFLQLANTYGVFHRDKNFTRYNAFSHVFAGGYAAGFYSYLWAEILETQVLRSFEKKWMMDQKTWQKYLDTILSQGSIKPAMELFRDFTGEDMNIVPFLERKGF